MTTETTVDFLLENLMQLINCDYKFILVEKDQIESLYEELRFLREFLKDSEKQRHEHEKVNNLVAQIRDVAYEAEDIIDLFVFYDPFLNLIMRKDRSVAEKFRHYAKLNLYGVLEEIKSIKTEVTKIYEEKLYDIRVLQVGKSSGGGSSRANTPKVEEETVVGFDDEAMKIIERLTGRKRQLEVLRIVGMAGLGKTTLAKKVYNDPLIEYHFHIRGWTCVSHGSTKRDILIGILNYVTKLTDKIFKMSNENLCEMLKKCLSGKRYLIVLDDIWDIDTWNDLRRSFPDDNNGSRIVFTSRHKDVSLHAKRFHLRFLNENESWDLLRQKAFQKESCPPELMDIGKQIAEKCQGLPLAIVVVGGILAKKDKTQDCWRHFAESVSSYIVSDPEQYMDTLAMSYNDLPHHLKACFLYFGAFPEDYEIPVRKLIWLWVAEGFIRRNEQKSLEEVAEDYLMDLIDRSLVVVTKRRSIGGIKTCRIHDLLRDLCLRKAQEENFLQQFSGYEDASASSSSSIPIATKQRRLCIHSYLVDYTSLKSYAVHVRSFLYFSKLVYDLSEKNLSFFCQAFRLLRVLNLSSVKISFFPKKSGQLVHLRYLALYLDPNVQDEFFLPSISILMNLEILIVGGVILPEWLIVPDDIWETVKLRHLYTKPHIKIPPVPNGSLFVLDNLQSIGRLSLSPGDEQVLARIPNLRKLKCSLFYWYSPFPKLDFLIHLQTLNVSDPGWSSFCPGSFLSLDKFPQNLKKLTLSNFELPWWEMSTLGSLPNLEVLILLDGAFKGRRWDTSNGQFVKLKILKFQFLYIVQWNSSSTHFPNLQRLVLDGCKPLQEIPSGLGDISTLETIEVSRCSYSLANSVRKIQEQQQSIGNDGLKILIDRCWDEI